MILPWKYQGCQGARILMSGVHVRVCLIRLIVRADLQFHFLMGQNVCVFIILLWAAMALLLILFKEFDANLLVFVNHFNFRNDEILMDVVSNTILKYNL